MLQKLGLARQAFVRGDEGGDRGVKLGQRTLDLPQAGRVLAPQQGKREPAGAVRRRGALAQQRGAGELELVQLGEDHRPRLLRRRLDHRAHAGDQPGVDPIGLGVGADRLGEAPDAGRVQLRTGNIGVVQRPLEGGMIGAGRLEGDACDLRADPADEPPVPGRVVGDPAGLAARPAAGVEMVFGDVHADGRLRHLSGAPCLSCEPRARFPFGSREGRGAIYLSTGPFGSAVMRSVPSPPPEGGNPPAATSSWARNAPTNRQAAIRSGGRDRRLTQGRAGVPHAGAEADRSSRQRRMKAVWAGDGLGQEVGAARTRAMSRRASWTASQ